MSKPVVIIADKDETYVSILQDKFLKEIGDHIDLQIITDIKYFNEYFSTPRTAEIAVFSEDLYSDQMKKHNFHYCYVLVDDNEDGCTEDLSVQHIYKYTAIREIYNELVYKSAGLLEQEEHVKNETCVIAFYSAVGGSGKTMASLALAESLTKNHKKVMYLNTESIQSFACMLDNRSGITNDGYRLIRQKGKGLYERIRHLFRNEGFTYLPPMYQTLDSIHIDFKIFEELIQEIRQSREYDILIVDVESGYQPERISLIEQADKVILVLKQDRSSLEKTEILLNCLDGLDSEKYLFVFSMYDAEAPDYFRLSSLKDRIHIHEKIGMLSANEVDLDHVSKLNGIEKIAYLFV